MVIVKILLWESNNYKSKKGNDNMAERVVTQGQIYKHFKGKMYQIICVAHHSETEESLVVYQALYGDFGICARPYDMFVSEVDREKYPDVAQKYRFELVGQVGPLGMSGISSKEESVKVNATKPEPVVVEKETVVDKKDEVAVDNIEEDNSGIDPVLLDFLNAKSYTAKKEIFSKVKKTADDKLLNDIAVSLDFVLPEGDLLAKYEAIYSCLNAHARFEVNRR